MEGDEITTFSEHERAHLCAIKVGAVDAEAALSEARDTAIGEFFRDLEAERPGSAQL